MTPLTPPETMDKRLATLQAAAALRGITVYRDMHDGSYIVDHGSLSARGAAGAARSGGRLVLTNKGTLAKWLQESVGDALLMRDERLYAVELKAERKHTGNLFLETWSNRNLESRASHAERGQTPGWLMKIRADLLLYYFIDADMLYSLDVLSLKRWVFGHGDGTGMWGSGRLRERRQGQYAQMNDTWGVLAPVAQLNDELPPGAMRFTKVRQRELEAA